MLHDGVDETRWCSRYRVQQFYWRGALIERFTKHACTVTYCADAMQITSVLVLAGTLQSEFRMPPVLRHRSAARTIVALVWGLGLLRRWDVPGLNVQRTVHGAAKLPRDTFALGRHTKWIAREPTLIPATDTQKLYAYGMYTHALHTEGTYCTTLCTHSAWVHTFMHTSHGWRIGCGHFRRPRVGYTHMSRTCTLTCSTVHASHA